MPRPTLIQFKARFPEDRYPQFGEQDDLLTMLLATVWDEIGTYVPEVPDEQITGIVFTRRAIATVFRVAHDVTLFVQLGAVSLSADGVSLSEDGPGRPTPSKDPMEQYRTTGFGRAYLAQIGHSRRPDWVPDWLGCA